jgi:hypothetical protein
MTEYFDILLSTEIEDFLESIDEKAKDKIL